MSNNTASIASNILAAQVKSTTTEPESKAHFLNKICNFAISILREIGNIFAFPLRYFGSKTWSVPGVAVRAPTALIDRLFNKTHQQTLGEQLLETGYRFGTPPPLLGDELKQLLLRNLPNACSTAYAYNTDPEWVKPFGYTPLDITSVDLPAAMGGTKGTFLDLKTGLKFELTEKNNEVVITFGIFQSYRSVLNKKLPYLEIKGITNVIFSGLGGVPELFEQAEWAYHKIKDHPSMNGKKISIVGYCFGGTIAQYVSLKHQVPALCINPYPLGAGLQWNIGEQKLKEAENCVKIISVKNDFVSDPHPILKFLDRAISLMGIRTPGSFGKRLIIPAASEYTSNWQIHNNALGSIMKNLGQENVKVKAWELPEALIEEAKKMDA